MNIRKYEKKDYKAIVNLYANAKLDEFKFENKAFTLIPLEDDKYRFKQLFESDIYVYDDKGIKACGAIYNNEIRSLFVHNSVRGQGIGNKLLLFLLSQMDGTIELNVVKSNLPAIRLYEKYGFKFCSEYSVDYNNISVLVVKMILPKS